jgi:predicted transcriptional regulator
MSEGGGEGLSRRERQIMDVVYRRGRATAAEVLAELSDPPSYSAVRALLRILEGKGHLRHEKAGSRYVFRPARSRERAARSALKRVLRTFFDGSAEKAVVALLDVSDAKLPQPELDRLVRLIEQAKKEGR